MENEKNEYEIRAFIELKSTFLPSGPQTSVAILEDKEPFDCRVTLSAWQGDTNHGVMFVGVGSITIMASLFPQFIQLQPEVADKPALSLVPESEVE